MPSLSVGLLSAKASTSAAAMALSASMALLELDGSRVVSSIVAALLVEGHMVITLALVSCGVGEDWASLSGGCDAGLGAVAWLLSGGSGGAFMLMIGVDKCYLRGDRFYERSGDVRVQGMGEGCGVGLRWMWKFSNEMMKFTNAARFILINITFIKSLRSTNFGYLMIARVVSAKIYR